MKMRSEVQHLLDKALAREPLSRQEATWLIEEVDPFSPENDALMGAAHQLTQESSGEKGVIHAQIGVNIAPCPHNCGFCSFAARSGLFKERIEMSPEEGSVQTEHTCCMLELDTFSGTLDATCRYNVPSLDTLEACTCPERAQNRCCGSDLASSALPEGVQLHRP